MDWRITSPPPIIKLMLSRDDMELSLAVVGLDYPNADRSKSDRRFEMMLCVPGEPVHLVPDPKNKADPRAVAVVSCRGIQLGYLTAERCGYIGRLLGRGEKHEAIFQEAGASAAIIRVRFGGGSPRLPSRTAPAGSEKAGDWDGIDEQGPEWGA